MNILVIGNGFDLAHGLPTKYTDFLEFCRMIKVVYYLSQNEKGYIFDNDENCSCLEGKKDMWDELDLKFSCKEKEFYSLFMKLCSKRRKAEWLEDEDEEIIITDTVYDEFNKLIKNNFWIDYFLANSSYQKENWIDFESEICKIIRSIDIDMNGKMFDGLSNKCLKEKYLYKGLDILFVDENGKGGNKQSITFKEIRNRLLNDLNKLIRALEIYLAGYVNKIQNGEESSDIKDIFEKKDEQGNITAFIDTKILSFNYTATFKRIYKHSFDIDYIHGKADINNTIDTNNMVLGIDEYLSKKRRDRETDFIAFKKFYQRIHKGTGCKYKEWIDTIKGDFADYQTELKKCKTEKNIMDLKVMVNKLKKQYLNKHHVYIFGHSLDVTDKDVLRDLILNDNVKTTIFYHDKDMMGQQIANLVIVIGQDELIRRTGGGTKTIEFKQQQKMVPINNW